MPLLLRDPGKQSVLHNYVRIAFAPLAHADGTAAATCFRAAFLHSLSDTLDRHRAATTRVTASAGAAGGTATVSPLGAVPVRNGGHCGEVKR